MALTADYHVLLKWLKEEKPDVVCLQELKAPQERFPLKAINDAEVPGGLAWAEKLERDSGFGNKQGNNGGDQDPSRRSGRQPQQVYRSNY